LNVIEFLQSIPALALNVYTTTPDPQSDLFAIVEQSDERVFKAHFGIGRPKVTQKTIIIHLFDPVVDTEPSRIINVENIILHGQKIPLIQRLETAVDADLTPGIGIKNSIEFVSSVGPVTNARVNALHIRMMFKILLNRM
jgi:hypothetical protein